MIGPGPTERGDVMAPTLVLLAALLAASSVLVSASEQWEARRKAAAAAATMARAAAQGDADLIRSGGDGIDATTAQRRLDEVLAVLEAADGETVYTGRITAIDGRLVTVEATASADYTFPLPGFPREIAGSARAEAIRGDTS